MLSDLDEAVAAGQKGNDAEMLRQAMQVVRAESYANQSAAGEIERLPEPGRGARIGPAVPLRALCRRQMKAAYARQSQEAMESELQRGHAAAASARLAELKAIRTHVEAARTTRVCRPETAAGLGSHPGQGGPGKGREGSGAAPRGAPEKGL